LLAAAGDTTVKEDLLKGRKVGDKTFKAHLDGYNQMDLLAGKGPGKRREKFYFDAEGNLNALRYEDWKITWTEMDGNIRTAWRKTPSWPIITNLRQDPYERFPTEAEAYMKWSADRMFLMVPAQVFVREYLETLKEFPPAQGSSLSINQVLESMQKQSARQ
jgi:arylsulfatase